MLEKIPRRALLLTAVATLALSLAACGKKGPLEPPEGSPDAAAAKARAEQKQQGPDTGLGVGQRGSRRPPPVGRPKGDFILDPLL